MPTTPTAQNTGHGHVHLRPDGARARCGGPAICRTCAAELAATQTAVEGPFTTSAPLDTTRAVAVDLRHDGILWAINTAVFHPRGFALASDTDGDLYLTGDGTEAVAFDDATIDNGFAAFTALLAHAAATNKP